VERGPRGEGAGWCVGDEFHDGVFPFDIWLVVSFGLMPCATQEAGFVPGWRDFYEILQCADGQYSEKSFGIDALD
jgi:hypothetical protein